MDDQAQVVWLEDVSARDTPRVGGKNSGLGEMIQALSSAGVQVPMGFATTASAYRRFLAHNSLEAPMQAAVDALQAGSASLQEAGAKLRGLLLGGSFPDELAEEIRTHYLALCERSGVADLDVAVRSSATAEDLPEASFAGQQETFLNVRGAEELLESCRRCYASLFTDRAIAYRNQYGFGHLDVALSVGVQQMVRSDLAGAGVLFTLDVDTGFPDIILISAAWGLGENVVQGTIEPDQYRVFKPFLGGRGQAVLERRRGSKKLRRVVAEEGSGLTRDIETTPEERASFVLEDGELEALARWGLAIERHMGHPMDIEWAKDGRTGELFIVQARPETVHAHRSHARLATYELQEQGRVLAAGLAIGQGIATGRVRVLERLDQIREFQQGEILVASVTNPDWLPVMRRAAGIVTDHGGRTSHAAIVARELGLPAVVGAGDATQVLRDGQEITLACTGSADEGKVYEGRLRFEVREVDLEGLPETRTKVLMNIGSPSSALAWWRLPAKGIGLARMEYLIGGTIRIHPMALAHFERVEDEAARAEIEGLTTGYPDKEEYFVDKLSQGIALMAASRYPSPVVVRLSDFKSNEYAALIGGRGFEPHEQEPMLGWRGASRYYDPGYRDGFALECKALVRVREMGFGNVVVMVPFCRTPEEADRVLEELAAQGLRRGEDGLQVWVMAEIPSNILEAEAFAERFDAFSIGSNDLTQLVLGVGRDAEKLRGIFDENRPSVRWMIQELITRAHRVGKTVSLCGQAPSDDPAFAAFLVEAGIDSISVIPVSVVDVLREVARAERALQGADEADAQAHP
jgi:pyruvate,water dikinase